MFTKHIQVQHMSSKCVYYTFTYHDCNDIFSIFKCPSISVSRPNLVQHSLDQTLVGICGHACGEKEFWTKNHWLVCGFNPSEQILVKIGIFPKFRDENKTIFWNHHLVTSIPLCTKVLAPSKRFVGFLNHQHVSPLTKPHLESRFPSRWAHGLAQGEGLGYFFGGNWHGHNQHLIGW